MNMGRRGMGVALFGVLLGCGPQSGVDGTGSGGSDEGTTSGPVPVTATTTTPPPPGTSSDTTEGFDTTDGILFLSDPDATTPPMCDFYAQDCFDGFKCVPFSETGMAWTGVACFPVVEGAGAPGDACTTERQLWSGYDDCDASSICWVSDEATLEGTCVGLCMGSLERPVCADREAWCTLNSDGVGVCWPPCSPLVQDCPAGQGCYEESDGTFACSPLASGGTNPPGEVCESSSGCDPGSVCLEAQEVPGCRGSGCCSSLCDLDDAMPPCLGGQSCEPWFGPGEAPRGQQNVGACGAGS